MILEKISTMLSHDPDVKCRVIRWLRSGLAVILGCLSVAYLSITMCNSFARVGLGDLFEKAQELLVTVAMRAGLLDVPGSDVECGDHGGGAVAHVVMGLLLRYSGRDRKDRDGPVQGLDLRLLVNAENHGVVRQVQIQAHGVADLRVESGVGGTRPGRWPNEPTTE
jgi:hypothetical protein